MSGGYDNSNEGVLFNARDKKSKETDRDYSGNAEVVCPRCNTCSDHWISAWINMSGKGMKYMKLKFNPKDQPSGGSQPGNRGQNPDGTTKPPPADDGFDDIPF